MQRKTAVIIDDDPIARLMCVETVAGANLEPVDFGTACGALAYLEQYADDSCLLVTDIRMSGMNGAELARIAAKRWPWIHIVAMSGHDGGEYGPLPPTAACLDKPYPMEALLGIAEECSQRGARK
jgi:DNA-binding NtrC family response regulator